MAGYSKRTLIDKLGIKEGAQVYIGDPPAGYDRALGKLPPGAVRLRELRSPCDFIHFFTTDRSRLQREFPKLKASLARDGILWVSWPKGASKVATDLNGNLAREIGLANGLVDVKVCAVDDVWSGLKFVYRLADRR